MEIKIKTKITSNDMYSFNLYDAYHSFRGWQTFFLAFIAFFIAGISMGKVSVAYTAVQFMIGLFFIIYLPITLKRSSEAAMKANPILAEPLEYTFNKEGVTLHTEVDLGEDPQTDSFGWDMVYKVVRTKNSLLIYMNARNAHILPMRDIESEYPKLEELLKNSVEEYKLKI